MRFRVERDVLADAVTWTARTLPTRPPVPVLAGVRIQADTTGTIELSSFDYEVSARSQIPADVTEAGTVLVSGRLLAEISRSLPDGRIDPALVTRPSGDAAENAATIALRRQISAFLEALSLPRRAGCVSALTALNPRHARRLPLLHGC